MSDSLLSALRARAGDARTIAIAWSFASLPDELTRAVLLLAPDLDSFLHAASTCHAWRSIALPLLHCHGKGGIWYRLCCRFDPAVVDLQSVSSYWRLHLKLMPNHALPGAPPHGWIRVEDLQFLLQFKRYDTMFSPSNLKSSLRLDGSDAKHNVGPPGPGENPGCWFWLVPGLLDQLGWSSINEAQVAAEQYDDAMHRNMEEHRAMSQSIRDGEAPTFHRTLLEMRIFHAPSQRLLPLGGNWIEARDPSSRDGWATSLKFYSWPLPRPDFGNENKPEISVMIDLHGRLYVGFSGQFDHEQQSHVMNIESALCQLQHATAWSPW